MSPPGFERPVATTTGNPSDVVAHPAAGQAITVESPSFVQVMFWELIDDAERSLLTAVNASLAGE